MIQEEWIKDVGNAVVENYINNEDQQSVRGNLIAL